MTKKIPLEVQRFINKYFELSIAGKRIVCPYFINTGGFLKEPVFAGKGDPGAIEEKATGIFSHISMVDKTEDLIRTEMVENGLGLDCSGLVYQVLDFWLKDSGKGELKDYLPKFHSINPRKILSRIAKPQASVSADMFTSTPLSKKVDVREVLPGDLIRTRGGKHILFVTEVEYENDSTPKVITFVNSAREYKRHGVRYSKIYLDKSLNFSAAKWEDDDPDEPVNIAYKGWRDLTTNNGIFRPELPLRR
jgi:hypothetical protein